MQSRTKALLHEVMSRLTLHYFPIPALEATAALFLSKINNKLSLTPINWGIVSVTFRSCISYHCPVALCDTWHRYDPSSNGLRCVPSRPTSAGISWVILATRSYLSRRRLGRVVDTKSRQFWRSCSFSMEVLARSWWPCFVKSCLSSLVWDRKKH